MTEPATIYAEVPPAPVPRVVVWSGAALAALLGVYLWVFMAPGGSAAPWSQALGQVAYLLPHLATVVLSASLAMRSASIERRFWLWLSLSSALLLAYEAAYSARVVFGLSSDWQAIQGLSALPLVAAAMFVMALVLVTRLGESTVLTRFRVLIDVLIEFIIAVEVSIMLVMEPLLGAFGATAEASLIGGIITVAGCFIVGWAALALLGRRAENMSSAERLVVIGVGVYGLGAVLWPVEWIAAFGTGYPWLEHWVPLLWMAGMGLVAVGAVWRLTDPRDTGVFTGHQRRYRPQTGPWTIPLIAGGGVVLTALWVLSAPDSLPLRIIVGDSIVVIALLLAARSLLVLVDSERGMLDSMTDPVSGVSTLSAFGIRLTGTLEAASRFDDEVALLVLDIDRFGEVNATRGHKEGDRVLADVGAALRSTAEGTDMEACRTSGDEFALLVPGMNGGTAYRLAVRLQAEVEAVVRRRGIPLSVSVGVASYPNHASDAGTLIAVAREALVQAKRDRAGSVLLYDPERLASGRAQAFRAPDYLDTIRIFARAVENRTPHVRGHGAGVARLAARLGTRLRLDEQRIRLLEIAGELHDVGFIGVPDRTIEKPGPLDGRERINVDTHPEMAARIIAALDIPEVLPWIRAHHENWDGTGYPRGLKGGEIPLGARILAVADAWDAMTSSRPYRRALDRDEAIEELGRGRGTHFDPAIVDEFFFIIDEDPGPPTPRP